MTTKRDLYYRDVELFGTQAVVDQMVTHIAYSFGVERFDLNIVASPKGCVFGDLTICTKAGKIIEIDSTNGVSEHPLFYTLNLTMKESLIPVDCDIDAIRPKEAVTAILVVEKEAVFRQLCQSLKSVIIITVVKFYFGIPNVTDILGKRIS